ncbi:MAG: hypothetical protein J1E41_04095 [Ruminococcus sp.]|nr:hypothetical protein [Ruminococcus sp.]
MSKNKILFFISAALFIFAFLLLIVAMMFHAVEGNNSILAIAAAITSALSAFVGFVIVLLSGRFRGREDRNEGSE